MNDVPDKQHKSVPKGNAMAAYSLNASYTILNSFDNDHPFDLMAYTIQEAIEETIEFWNGAEGSHKDFEVQDQVTDEYGGVTFTIEGTVTYEYQDNPPHDDVIRVTIYTEPE